MKNVGHINRFAFAKQLQALMRSLVAYIQGSFGFKKMWGTDLYLKRRTYKQKADELFHSVYDETVS